MAEIGDGITVERWTERTGKRRIQNVTVHFQPFPDDSGRCYWYLSNTDGRYNNIVTSGTRDSVADAVEEATKWITEWHGRRAARYGR